MQNKLASQPESALLRLERRVSALPLPHALKRGIVSGAAGFVVPFVRTGAVSFRELGPGRALLAMPNRRRVQNHMKTVHASAMYLLAETATGTVLNCSLPDGSRYAVTHTDIRYPQKAVGEITAQAELSAEQQERIAQEASGSVVIEATIRDARGEVCAVCAVHWNWKHPVRR